MTPRVIIGDVAPIPRPYPVPAQGARLLAVVCDFFVSPSQVNATVVFRNVLEPERPPYKAPQ